MAPYIQFGSGFVLVNPIGGNLATNPTGQRPLTVQDVDVEIAIDLKDLKGQFGFPDDVATGDKKGTGKFKFGRKDWNLFNQVLFADTIATGGTTFMPIDAYSVPASPGPYTITVAPPEAGSPPAGTFVADWGVQYANGNSFQRVSALTGTAGQYTVNSSGVYTFNAADAGAAILINYSYSLSTQGASYEINQQYLGYGPICQVALVDTYKPILGANGKPIYNGVLLYQVRFGKLGTIGNKRVDYSMPELDFQFYADATGRVSNAFSVNG
jgi:hypothetical protein